MERIGIYLCECGPELAERLDLGQLASLAGRQPEVALVRTSQVLCSPQGQQQLQEDISRHQLTRVVIAACSPKEHEQTFRSCLERAGLNPFLLQMANLREQCAWVTGDRAEATDKARALLGAALARVRQQRPLESREITSQPDVAVVGGGVAGLSAALALAQPERRVFVVEASPCLGGQAALYEDLYPSLECAACELSPLLDQVLHHPRITLLTLSQVQGVKGFYGNFTLTVRQQSRYVDPTACLGCGACLEPCPVRVPNEYNQGLDQRPAIHIPYPGALPHLALIAPQHCLRWQGQDCQACQEACPFDAVDFGQAEQIHELSVGAVVLAIGLGPPDTSGVQGHDQAAEVYSALELERLLNQNGPTNGQLVMKNGQAPESVVLVREVEAGAGERVGAAAGLSALLEAKYLEALSRKLPEAQISLIKAQPGSIQISRTGQGLAIALQDMQGLSGQAQAQAQMAVILPRLKGSPGAPALARLFELELDQRGFFQAESAALAPVASSQPGVFLAGTASGPKDVAGSVGQGQAAAGLILSSLRPGQTLPLEPMTCRIDPELCSGCGLCLQLCPYQAIARPEDQGPWEINQVLCRGCGICAALCPSGAVIAEHFSDQTLSAELRGLLHPWGEA